ncbi:MAG: hypothetical protein A2Y74_03235 [Actinobacteria bacterium RBG_13_63_9]|nr:MAG: hypothetical protein A2Y74_03235 [Actinobacteria bacterium RBG_13_63_9]
MISVKRRSTNRSRRGAPWTEEEDERLLAVAHLPPRAIADRMRRSWLACRRRLSYLRAEGNGTTDTRFRRSASARR